MVKRIILIMTGVLCMLSLCGCGGQKYKLNYDGYGFESKKTEYAAGEKVTVRYDMIGTDTDYSFFIDDDVEMKQDYDGGYVLKFTMPAHDVTLRVESHNSMEYIPETELPEPETLPEEDSGEADRAIAAELDETKMVFDYFRGTVATADGDGHDEMVLYGRTEGEGLILANYRKPVGEDEESRRLCIVPESVLEDCMKAVDKYQVRDWNGSLGLDGGYYVVKFYDGDQMIRKSSDEMPADGMGAFTEIENILYTAWGQYAPETEKQ